MTLFSHAADFCGAISIHWKVGKDDSCVLFVDDEPQILDGLRRNLRAYRREWTMGFCEGAEQALSAMAESPFDVIVSDLQMPGMDGAELLTRVRDQYPDTVRIVLSGQSEQERILQAVGPAHQYLSKPCDPEFLKKTITSASLLNKRMNNPKLNALCLADGFAPLAARYLF